jgi:hypothetical protein
LFKKILKIFKKKNFLIVKKILYTPQFFGVKIFKKLLASVYLFFLKTFLFFLIGKFDKNRKIYKMVGYLYKRKQYWWLIRYSRIHV